MKKKIVRCSNQRCQSIHVLVTPTSVKCMECKSLFLTSYPVKEWVENENNIYTHEDI